MKNKYEIRGDVTAIFLKIVGSDEVVETLIDTKELPVAQLLTGSWRAFQRTKYHGLYATGDYWKNSYQHKSVYLHRYLLDAKKGEFVDHINHNTLDNTLKNIRIVTSEQNNQNRKGATRNNKTGIRGVSFAKNAGKWTVNVWINKKRYYLGLYEDITEAEIIAKEFRAKHMPFSQEAL